MAEHLIELTETLNRVLTEENALLDALDLPAAMALLGRKRDAVAALQAMLSNETQAAPPAPAEPGRVTPEAAEAEVAGPNATDLEVEARREKLRDGIRRLTVLGHANRAAIERGLALQTRLIQTIAQAVPRARALEAPVYQPNGSQMPPRPPEAYAFVSRM